MAKKTLNRRKLLAVSGATASLNIVRSGTLFSSEKGALSKLSVGFIGMITDRSLVDYFGHSPKNRTVFIFIFSRISGMFHFMVPPYRKPTQQHAFSNYSSVAHTHMKNTRTNKKRTRK